MHWPQRVHLFLKSGSDVPGGLREGGFELPRTGARRRSPTPMAIAATDARTCRLGMPSGTGSVGGHPLRKLMALVGQTSRQSRHRVHSAGSATNVCDELIASTEQVLAQRWQAVQVSVFTACCTREILDTRPRSPPRGHR